MAADSALLAKLQAIRKAIEDLDLSAAVNTVSGGVGISNSGTASDPILDHDAHTGDVTGSTVLTIGANAVTNPKLADMPTLTLKGNDTGVLADPKDLTVAEVNTMLGGVGTAASENYPIRRDSSMPTEVSIGEMPLFELMSSLTRGAVGHFMLPADIDLTVNPVLNVMFAVTMPGAGNANVQFSAAMKYIAVGELVSKAVDETILVTKAVINTDEEVHMVEFTLDRTKIAVTDHLEIHLTRIGGDAADTFTGRVGLMEAVNMNYTRK